MHIFKYAPEVIYFLARITDRDPADQEIRIFVCSRLGRISPFDVFLDRHWKSEDVLREWEDYRNEAREISCGGAQ
jgi:hypothetical protein